MKVFISADIEGVNGTTTWHECDKRHADYSPFAKQMTDEVAAACQGAIAAGASEILVRDAHDSAGNILAERLPDGVSLLRGWSGHPYLMMDGLDESFGAVVFVGYHAGAGSSDSPLAHTISSKLVHTIKINGRLTSEFMINSYTAALCGVPVAFISGDNGICTEATQWLPNITTAPVKQGLGNATINIPPARAIENIRAGVQKALEGNLAACQVMLPDEFLVEINFKRQHQAYAASFYPNTSRINAYCVQFTAEDYFDILRMFSFVLTGGFS